MDNSAALHACLVSSYDNVGDTNAPQMYNHLTVDASLKRNSEVTDDQKILTSQSKKLKNWREGIDTSIKEIKSEIEDLERDITFLKDDIELRIYYLKGLKVKGFNTQGYSYSQEVDKTSSLKNILELKSAVDLNRFSRSKNFVKKIAPIPDALRLYMEYLVNEKQELDDNIKTFEGMIKDMKIVISPKEE